MHKLVIANERNEPSATLEVDPNILVRDLKQQFIFKLGLEKIDSRLEFRGKVLRDLCTLSVYNLPPGATLTIKSNNERQVTVILKYLGQDFEVITFVDKNIHDVLQAFMSKYTPRSSSFLVIYRGMTLSNSDRLPNTQHPIVMYLMDIKAPRLLRVLTLLGELVQITFSDDCKVQDFKQQLETEHGFPSADTFCLLHNGKILTETSTIKDCDIGEGTVLQVHLIQHGDINIRCEKNTFTIENVKSIDLVEDIKRIIFKIYGYEVEIQKLIYRSKELKDNLALLNYDIRFGSTLNLVLLQKGFSVYVEHQDGRRIKLEVSKLDTVINLKAMIKAKENIPIDSQRLVFEEIEVDDLDPLLSYGIVEGSTLKLVDSISPTQEEVKIGSCSIDNTDSVNEIMNYKRQKE
jgi:hypothetical protein